MLIDNNYESELLKRCQNKNTKENENEGNPKMVSLLKVNQGCQQAKNKKAPRVRDNPFPRGPPPLRQIFCNLEQNSQILTLFISIIPHTF